MANGQTVFTYFPTGTFVELSNVLRHERKYTLLIIAISDKWGEAKSITFTYFKPGESYL